MSNFIVGAIDRNVLTTYDNLQYTSVQLVRLVALVPLAGSVPSMTTAYYRYVVMTYCTSVQLVRLVALVPLSWECPEYDHSLPPECYPQLDYSAPELALLGTITPAADMFSYGMLAFRYKFSIILTKKLAPFLLLSPVSLKSLP